MSSDLESDASSVRSTPKKNASPGRRLVLKRNVFETSLSSQITKSVPLQSALSGRISLPSDF